MMALSLKMELKLTPELRQLGIRVAVGALLLAAAAYVIIALPVMQGRKLDAEIATAKADLARQQSLVPALASLNQDAQNASIAALMPPKSAPVPRTRVYLMPEQINRLAKSLGVEPLDVGLDPGSLAQDPNAIRLNGVFSGPTGGCRGLLMELGALP
ncbi:hypothetical protein EOM89_13300, partial [Candidatus Falkowbacteria bacterium]|nr:hypothetical protein [Candidatus Falkowbacteria bacterium]